MPKRQRTSSHHRDYNPLRLFNLRSSNYKSHFGSSCCVVIRVLFASQTHLQRRVLRPSYSTQPRHTFIRLRSPWPANTAQIAAKPSISNVVVVVLVVLVVQSRFAWRVLHVKCLANSKQNGTEQRDHDGRRLFVVSYFSFGGCGCGCKNMYIYILYVHPSNDLRRDLTTTAPVRFSSSSVSN